jgi:hypothetical protein
MFVIGLHGVYIGLQLLFFLYEPFNDLCLMALPSMMALLVVMASPLSMADTN